MSLTMFEEETGIDVVYEEFETNEILYPKVQFRCNRIRRGLPELII